MLAVDLLVSSNDSILYFLQCILLYNRLLTTILGKSSLAVQFVDGHFVDSYYPTIENTFSKTIRYKGQDFTTEIVDTAGQVSYRKLQRLRLGC